MVSGFIKSIRPFHSSAVGGGQVGAKLLLIMRITAFILLTACLTASAHGYSQKVTLSEKNARMEKVFKEIKKQTGFEFLYTYEMLKPTVPVTVNLKNAELADALAVCFADQPLTYIIIEKTVVVKSKNEEVRQNLIVAPPMDITGKITDAEGKPLEGASVLIRGMNNGTGTDKNGFFSLKGVLPENEISVSYAGYIPQILKVGNRKKFVVVLELSNNPLDEVHVIAYGTTTQRFSVGNITKISGETIAQQPVNNPLLALEGRVPGLFVTQTSGISGSGVKVQLQGQNSLANGTAPFYVVDGVPFASQTLLTMAADGILLRSSGNPSNQGGYGTPFSYLNPSDIESIEVLKDAEATAIYGSRAANGAILITTKKGKAGRTMVNFDLQQGWGQVAKEIDLLNTQQALQMRKEAFRNDGLPMPSLITNPNNTNYDLNGIWDTTRYTDWQKTLIGGTAQYSNYSASVSGGNSNTQYLIGGTYHRETTVFPGSFSDRKASLHLNLNSTSVNQKFRVQFTGNYLFDDNQLPLGDLTPMAIQLAPDAPALYQTDGTLNWQLKPSGDASWANPLSSIAGIYRLKTNNLVANINASYEIFRGLALKVNAGYTNLQMNEFLGGPLTALDPANQAAAGANGRSAGYSFNNTNSWIVEPQATYKKVIGKGRLDVLTGATIQQQNANGLYLSVYGFASDALLSDFRSASTLAFSSTDIWTYKYNAAFGRASYNWKEKYLVDLNIRRDGSSRFGSANEFHNFSSAGIGWIFSQEDFVKRHLSFLSFGKIRGSYGVTGNDQIGDYKFMDLYNSVSTGVAYQGSPALTARGLPNPYLQWEETQKLQVGLEIGLFNNRIFLTANYINNRSSNQLTTKSLPSVAGFGTIATNLAATIQNTAGEFLLNTINIKTRDFQWSSSFNFTLPQNKLLSFPNNPSPSLYVIGKPLGIVRKYHYLGVDPATGTYQFADSHGNPTPTPSSVTDQVIITEPAFPKYYGGLQNSFQYKGFSLDVLFQFVKQIGNEFNYGTTYPGRTFFSGFVNQPVSVLDRWQKPGDIVTVQRYSTAAPTGLNAAYNAFLSSDATVTDVSFIRLKNLALSYSFPEKLSHRWKLQNLRFFIQGQNLMTITKFKGLDPETGTLALPPLRVLTMGLNMSL